MKKFLQIGVKALFINRNNRVLLIRRSGTTDAPKGVWDIPGGRIELGEEPTDGLIREVKEEIGDVKFAIIGPIQVKSRINDDSVQIVRVTFECKLDSSEIKLSTEHDAFKWFSIRKLPQNVDNLTREAIIQIRNGMGS